MSSPYIVSREVFEADLERLNAALREAGAVRTGTDPDGETFQYIDTAKVPAALVKTYRNLVATGYASGHL